jgi:hypothetical protein
MKIIRRCFSLLLPAACLFVAGCGGTQINSDLVLDADASAVMELQSKTDAIELYNESDAFVRVRVLDRKRNVLTDLPLGSKDRVKLDLDKARHIEFDNQSRFRAMIRWTLTDDDPINYSLAVHPGTS